MKKILNYRFFFIFVAVFFLVFNVFFVFFY